MILKYTFRPSGTTTTTVVSVEKAPVALPKGDNDTSDPPKVVASAPVNRLPYKEYRFCLEPILQLPTFERLSERALHDVIDALDESASRANERQVRIYSETRNIIMMIHHLLDQTTQVLVYTMIRQVEGRGELVNLNMLVGCLVDRSENIMPEEVQLEQESRDI